MTKLSHAEAVGTIFPKRVTDPTTTRILKPGGYNKKLGSVVTKGLHTGAAIWSLSLEERATCPRECKLWRECYGNNMQWAQRIDHRHPAFFPQLSREIDEICSASVKVQMRLHVLGDFYSLEYVDFWREKLQQHSNLNAFGYTANPLIGTIGMRIRMLTVEFGWSRWALRFSGLERNDFGAVVHKPGDPPANHETFSCPEQQGKVKSCAECGACWNWSKTVQFVQH